MGQSCRKMCCCCKNKKEEEQPLLDDEELATGGGIEDRQQAEKEKLLTRSVAKYHADKVRPSPDVDASLNPIEQGLARYNVRAERKEGTI